MSGKASSRNSSSKPSPRKEKRRFAPGETIEKSGVYEAFHATHRITHEVTLLAGQCFPCCARCKDKVRFELVRETRQLDPQTTPIVHIVGVFLPEAA